jgi:hypothetical protein
MYMKRRKRNNFDGFVYCIRIFYEKRLPKEQSDLLCTIQTARLPFLYVSLPLYHLPTACTVQNYTVELYAM